MDVAVVVLGDVGRSPRMQYHVVSLSRAPWVRSVLVVGLGGTALVREVCESDKVQMSLVGAGGGSAQAGALESRLFLLRAPLKALRQSAGLLLALLRAPSLDLVLVQNPPCIPTFAVLAVVRVLRGTRVVVDWHNLGFTIMALSSQLAARGGERHWLVRLARAYERVLGRWLGDAHLCVTGALKAWLEREFALPGAAVVVQYDRAPAMFRRLGSAVEQHPVLERLCLALGLPRNEFTAAGADRADRPRLVVSSTSWTADEDFGILLRALAALDRHAGFGAPGARRVVCVVTGMGPQKAMYEARMREAALRNVVVRTVWLEPVDYPLLLGCADLGVCLHTSSSGLDLPMKVVDMFGSGLPVCAVDYPCLGELVQDGVNGRVFRDEAQLVALLASLLLEPGNEARLAALREGTKAFAVTRWAEHWDERTAPKLRALGTRVTLARRVPIILLALALLAVAASIALRLLSHIVRLG
jgi:beta-1,4-mannosyltransferase